MRLVQLQEHACQCGQRTALLFEIWPLKTDATIQLNVLLCAEGFQIIVGTVSGQQRTDHEDDHAQYCAHGRGKHTPGPRNINSSDN